MNIPLSDASVDVIICKSVLEHVKNPFRAVDEIYRISKPEGECLIYAPFLYLYHGNDYWRFSKDDIRNSLVI